ncbi:hypothetical protein MFLAVUS_008407 [Mucor flavus]|uniref:Uncharacterized protein n=1 Tax=Mucor flavus TaxID=439312 RepID=A0ABP9Z753_9FUNG
MRMDTDEYDKAHYSYPSCWFHCPLEEMAAFQDHTIMERNPRRTTIDSEEEDDMYMGTNSHRRSPASSPNSRLSSGLRNYSTNCSQDFNSSDEEEVAIICPTSRQSRILDDRKDVSSISRDSKSELYQKMDELISLFGSLVSGAIDRFGFGCDLLIVEQFISATWQQYTIREKEIPRRRSK